MMKNIILSLNQLFAKIKERITFMQLVIESYPLSEYNLQKNDLFKSIDGSSLFEESSQIEMEMSVENEKGLDLFKELWNLMKFVSKGIGIEYLFGLYLFWVEKQKIVSLEKEAKEKEMGEGEEESKEGDEKGKRKGKGKGKGKKGKGKSNVKMKSKYGKGTSLIFEYLYEHAPTFFVNIFKISDSIGETISARMASTDGESNYHLKESLLF